MKKLLIWLLITISIIGAAAAEDSPLLHTSADKLTMQVGERWDIGEADDVKLSKPSVVSYADGVLRTEGSGSCNVKVTVSGEMRQLRVRVVESGYLPRYVSRDAADGKPAVRTECFGFSELGRELLCTVIGSEEAECRVMLVFCQHAFEDRGVRDGVMLTQAADRLIDRLSEALPNGMCVYVIPCLNPDGAIGGETTTGIGRDNAALINLNRDYDAQWVPCDDIRNRTGDAPFAAAETRALRDLAERAQPTLIVDVHGYIDCVYQDGSEIAERFAQGLGMHVSGLRGNGMLALWASERFGAGVLVEMPLINSRFTPDDAARKLIKGLEAVGAE